MSLVFSTLVSNYRIFLWLWKILLDIINKDFVVELIYTLFGVLAMYVMISINYWTSLQRISSTMEKCTILMGPKYPMGFQVLEKLFLFLNRRKAWKWDGMPVYWLCSVFFQFQNLVATLWFLQNYKLTLFSFRLYMCLRGTLERVNSTKHSWLK